MTDEEKFKRRLLGNLLWLGARNLKISERQRMKLEEWVIPYTKEELDISLSSEPLKTEDIRLFIDRWEHADLSPENYKYYYVDKNSNGKSLRDLL